MTTMIVYLNGVSMCLNTRTFGIQGQWGREWVAGDDFDLNCNDCVMLLEEHKE